jgi:hypothetical protein
LSGISRLILIRHGEKTDDPQDPGLSGLGLKRAHFLKTYLPQRFGHLHRLFAAENKPKSSRPVETLEPLAKSLSIEIEQWPTDDVAGIASKLAKHEGQGHKHVVLCWRHDRMAKLAYALGVAKPPAWEPTSYDAVWIIEPKTNGFLIEQQGFSAA